MEVLTVSPYQKLSYSHIHFGHACPLLEEACVYFVQCSMWDHLRQKLTSLVLLLFDFYSKHVQWSIVPKTTSRDQSLRLDVLREIAAEQIAQLSPYAATFTHNQLECHSLL